MNSTEFEVETDVRNMTTIRQEVLLSMLVQDTPSCHRVVIGRGYETMEFETYDIMYNPLDNEITFSTSIRPPERATICIYGVSHDWKICVDKIETESRHNVNKVRLVNPTVIGYE